MKVICAGAPKTGTKSLAKALRILGYDPVYDVEEAMEFAFKEWEDVWNQEQPDLTVLLETVYANVEAVVDMPHSTFFDYFLRHWPNAKVILMTRDEDSWFRSYKQMCDRGQKEHGNAGWLRYISPSLRRLLRFIDHLLYSTIGVKIPHAFIWKNWYRRHNAYVRSTVPKDQLLEYNVTQGWEPICNFLNKSVPEEKFPIENRAHDDRNIGNKVMEDIWIAKKAEKEIKFIFTITPLVLIGLLAWYFYF